MHTIAKRKNTISIISAQIKARRTDWRSAVGKMESYLTTYSGVSMMATTRMSARDS